MLTLLAGRVQTVTGADTLHIDESFTCTDLTEVGGLYRTSDQDLNIEQVLALGEEAFLPLSGSDVTLYSLDEVCWTKVLLHNALDRPVELLLEVVDNRINEVQFFAWQAGRLRRSAVAGDYYPFDRREIRHPSLLYPVLLAPDETVTCFVHYRKIGETIDLDTRIWERQHFREVDRADTIGLAVFFGFMGCILLLVTFIALFLRARLFNYFIVYILACLLLALQITGYGFMYLWKDHPYWNGMGYSFVGIYYLSLVGMLRRYFETADRLPRFDLFFRVAALTIAVLLVFVCFHWYLPVLVKQITGRLGLSVLLLLNVGVVAVSLTAYYRFRKVGYLYFLLGFIFCLAAILLFEIEQFTAVDTPWGKELTVIAMALDQGILLLLFSNQIRLTYRQQAVLEQQLARTKLQAADALLAGQLEERRRLSQALHDGVSSQLALFKMKLDHFLSSGRQSGEELLADVGAIAGEVRHISHAISPLKLEQQSLTEAIDDQVYQVETLTGMQVETRFELDEERLPPKVQYAFYYTLQELLNNTVRHAGATEARIEWACVDGQPELRYRDNGAGLARQEAATGIGLRNIRARAELLNGGFELGRENGWTTFRFWAGASCTG
jgi:signal transduction histidine kinase